MAGHRAVNMLLLVTCGIASAELVVKDSGITPVHQRDIGIIFYVEVRNHGRQRYELNVRMIQCCENISREDIDCEHMQLVGGNMGSLLPRAPRNVTIVWPTFYPYDRVGECLIAIEYLTEYNETGEIRHKIRFDTRVSTKKVPRFFQGYCNPGDAMKCATVDLDTLNNCRPVNCHAKYNGKRNFFDRRCHRCQPVPTCIADSRKELPDVAYVPASNTCRNLENAVDEADVRALSQGIAETAWRSEPQPYLSNVYCHHGYTDNATGFCICEEGWTSFPVDNLEPTAEMIHLCNVQVLPWPRSHFDDRRTLLLIFASLLAVLLILFCGAMAYVMRGYPPSANRKTRSVPSKTSCAINSAKSLGSARSTRSALRFHR